MMLHFASIGDDVCESAPEAVKAETRSAPRAAPERMADA
jgi:hypothetical protein